MEPEYKGCFANRGAEQRMEHLGEPHLGRAALTAQWEPAPSSCAPPCPSCSQCVPRASSLPPTMPACKGRPKPFSPHPETATGQTLPTRARCSLKSGPGGLWIMRELPGVSWERPSLLLMSLGRAGRPLMVWLVPQPSTIPARQKRMLLVTLPLLHLFPCSGCYEESNHINIAY